MNESIILSLMPYNLPNKGFARGLDNSCFTLFIGFFHSSHQQELAEVRYGVPVSSIVEVTILMLGFFLFCKNLC